MNPDYQIITLKDGVTKAVQFAGPTFTTDDLQAQIAPLQSQLNDAQNTLPEYQAQVATAQQKIADLQAQIAMIQAQIDALNDPDVVATPTTIENANPVQSV
jgi:peptidoglycan hydrolase CwlO-like protein